MSKTSDYLNALYGGGSTGSLYGEMGLAQRRANEQARQSMARVLEMSRRPTDSSPKPPVSAGDPMEAATSSAHPVALMAAIAASALVVMPWLITIGAMQSLAHLMEAFSVRQDFAPIVTFGIVGCVLYLLSAGISRNHPWVAFVGSCLLLVRHFSH